MLKKLPLCRALVLLGLLLFLIGCGQQPVNETTETLESQELVLPDAWRVTGRLSLVMPDEQLHGRFYWQQMDNGFLLRLSDPIGRTLLELKREKQQVTLTTDDQVLHYQGQASQFLYQETGWLLPVEELPFWLWGQASPTRSANWQAQDTERALTQAGWNVVFEKYTDEVPGNADYTIKLPKKVTITNHRFRLRLAINQHKLEQP